MDISIFGLGYVGTVSAACLSREGYNVVGVDISAEKVAYLNEGRSPVIEDQLETLIRDGVSSGRLRATTDAKEAIQSSDMGLICVGTPSMANSALDTRYVEKVTSEIGGLIRDRTRPFLYVLRSTVLPGTVTSMVIPILEAQSGRSVGEGFEVLFHPEFLREGSAVHDYYDPPKIVVGERAPGASQPVIDLYDGIAAPRFVTSIEAAEMVKYADNAFHAVKITFANEIGRICHAHDIDSREVMDMFVADTKLNISPRYLRPGFAFGGSCLPKDLRALLYTASVRGLAVPMLEGVLSSNASHIERALELIMRSGARKVGLVGLSFKPGTDDLRESPLVELAERLIGKGMDVRILDDYVRNAWLVGSNKAYVEEHLPHLVEVLVGSQEDLDNRDIIVVGHPVASDAINRWLDKGIGIFDLIGSSNGIKASGYQGIVW